MASPAVAPVPFTPPPLTSWQGPAATNFVPPSLDSWEGPAKSSGFLQGASDDDIIRHYGYDPAIVKKAKLYSPGSVAGYVSPSNDTSVSGKLANSTLGDMGQGVFRTGAGIAQLATHALHGVGVASDADTQYADLITRLQNDNYEQNVRHGNPGHAGQLAGQLLIPIPGGPAAETTVGGVTKATLPRALARGAVSGGVAAAMQPIDMQSPDGDYAAQKAGQIATGSALGTALGGVLHGAGNLINKGINYLSTKLPEETAAQLQAMADASALNAKDAADTAAMRIAQEKATTQAAADAAAGKVLQAKAAVNSAKANMRSGVTGAVANSQQAAADLATHQANLDAATVAAKKAADAAADSATGAVSDKASLATSALRDAMGDTPFHGTEDLINAAASGDGSAGQVLRQIQESGDNPDRIQRASIQLQNWNTRQVADQLYSHVADMAKTVAPGDVPLNQTEGALSSAINRAQASKLPDNDLVKTLKTIQNKLGAGDEDELVDNSYGNLRQFDDELGALIRGGQKGTNKLISDTQVPVLASLRTALRADMDRYTQSVPELKEAADKADQYYKTVRVPFKQPDIANAGAATDADQIYNGLIKTGGGDQAQRYYNALDPRGRATVRYQMATDAVNAATDTARGSVDPEKLYGALDNVSAAHGVFFQGQDAAEFNGLKNLAKQAILAQDAAKSAGPSAATDGADLIAEAQQRIKAAREAVQRARATRSANVAYLERNLAQETAMAQATAEDVARTSAGREMVHNAAAENAKIQATADQSAADKAKAIATEARGKPFGIVPALGGVAGAGGAEVLASLAHVPGASLIGPALGAATIIKFLTQTPAGRRYLLASSNLQAGTPAMRNLLNTITTQAAATAARAATMPTSTITEPAAMPAKNPYRANPYK